MSRFPLFPSKRNTKRPGRTPVSRGTDKKTETQLCGRRFRHPPGCQGRARRNQDVVQGKATSWGAIRKAGIEQSRGIGARDLVMSQALLGHAIVSTLFLRVLAFAFAGCSSETYSTATLCGCQERLVSLLRFSKHPPHAAAGRKLFLPIWVEESGVYGAGWDKALLFFFE